MNTATSAEPAQTNATTRLHAVVRGRVQGVGFRYWAHHTARDLEIVSGQIRNKADGSVEVEAEHQNRAVLENLLKALHDGPTSAHVESVHAMWEEQTAPRYPKTDGLLVA